MEDIRKVFTIQWVGPFETFASLFEYLNDPNTCDCHLFSFYYCSGSKKGKGHPISKDDYRYFGLHRSGTPIHMRVAPWHEHLKNFREPFSLWIGSFSDSIQQTPENIEDVETVFISTYKDVLTENTQKKKATPKESICIINLCYRSNEQRWLNKKRDIKVFDDVLVYEAESMTYSKGNLSIV